MNTIGERIAQLRKENGLSQELFGEALGVSRQAISKWESNQSVPEVEKLLAMHRLYGVSVGWLLGTEDERSAPDELTDEQLSLVDQIVQKYIDAIPKPDPTSKKVSVLWKLSAVIFGLAFLINSVNIYNRFNSLDNQQKNLEYSIDRIQSSVDREVQSIGNRVEEIISKQNSILAEYSAEYAYVNLSEGTMHIDLSATPKTYVSGMQLDFVIEDGTQTITVRGTEGENRRYTAQADCKLTNAVDVSVVLHSGGTEQMQLIQSWTYLFSETKAGADTMDWETELWANHIDSYKDYTTIPLNSYTQPYELLVVDETGKHPTISVEKMEYLVYVNGHERQHIMTKPGVSEFMINNMTSAEYVEHHGLEPFCGFLNVEFIPQMNVGDTLDILVIITDNYDRRYIANGCSYTVDDDMRFSFAQLDVGQYNIEGVTESPVKW